MSLLEISALTKRFGGVVAVDGCSLSVADRSITGLIGPNGSGKTTVFNLVTGFIPRDSGEVRFKSRSIAGLGPDRIYRLGIGRTFLLVEHNMSFVMNLCDEVVVLHQGKAIASGKPKAVRENPAVLDAYLGA